MSCPTGPLREIELNTLCNAGLLGRCGRFAAILAMPVLPIGEAIGRDGRGKNDSELDSPPSQVLHEISGLDRRYVL
jgi:hypothetical protein